MFADSDDGDLKFEGFNFHPQSRGRISKMLKDGRLSAPKGTSPNKENPCADSAGQISDKLDTRGKTALFSIRLSSPLN
jgi:hypothetical protein